MFYHFKIIKPNFTDAYKSLTLKKENSFKVKFSIRTVYGMYSAMSPGAKWLLRMDIMSWPWFNVHRIAFVEEGAALAPVTPPASR